MAKNEVPLQSAARLSQSLFLSGRVKFVTAPRHLCSRLRMITAASWKQSQQQQKGSPSAAVDRRTSVQAPFRIFGCGSSTMSRKHVIISTARVAWAVVWFIASFVPVMSTTKYCVVERMK
jgi:hypothetical protein